MDDDWGTMPSAFGHQEEAEGEHLEEFPIIGEPGIQGKSARPRAGAEAEGAGEGEASAEAAVKESDKKKRKPPSAKKILKRMKDAKHSDHEHAQWTRLVDDDDGRLHCQACGTSFWGRHSVKSSSKMWTSWSCATEPT